MRPDTGISEGLAKDRAARISDLRYDLSFSLPADRRATIAARESLSFTLTDASQPLVIDFAPNRAGRLHAVEAGGAPITAPAVNGHIVVPAAALRAGHNTLTFRFDAGDAPLNRSDDLLYTIFVPARAHEVFPCFDQPDLKARWRLSLEIPDGWEAIANGAEASRESRGGRTTIAFDRTQLVSTYLFAFGAGALSIDAAERRGRVFRMLHRETDAQKVARNRDAIFDLHAAALDWLEDYTGIAYPFGKLDVLLVPSFQFGGMEHPGAIFYNAAGLLLEESATENQRLDRASLISHETTHMWFGNLVTMRWFADVWMKEVFANYLAPKIVGPSFPAIDHELRFLLAYYPSAYDVDRTAGANAIRQPLANLNEAGSLYGAIIYHKAPIVMRQLEMLIGADSLRDGLRQYLRRYSYGNASWPDLIHILDSRTAEDLAAWSHAWVDEPGRPSVATDVRIADGRVAALTLTQKDPDPNRRLLWNQELNVALGYPDRVQLVPAHLNGASADVTSARGLPEPQFVLAAGGGIGYGDFRLDRRSREWLVAHLPEIDDALTRGSAWVTLWDAMLDAEIPPSRIIDLALVSLPRETDELNVERLLGYLGRAYWRFTPDDRRHELAPRVEHALRDRLAAWPTPSLKSACFSTLRDTALTPATLGWLAAVWSEEEQVDGLTFAEHDFIVLSEELAIRSVPGWQAIVARQVERTNSVDRRARLRFVAPALSDDPVVRDRFFETLKEPSQRVREAWVIEAMRYLNHPLRAAESIKYLEPSLELLHTIQRTGDIFFPKRWMDATLAGHRSSAAAGIVRAFVERLPAAYPDHLRRIILSSADELFRVADR